MHSVSFRTTHVGSGWLKVVKLSVGSLAMLTLSNWTDSRVQISPKVKFRLLREQDVLLVPNLQD